VDLRSAGMTKVCYTRGPAPILRCACCDVVCRVTVPAKYVPLGKRAPIELELCVLCHERLRLGDRRLMETLELKLLLAARP
jgi:hypothetical protein